MRGEKDIEEKVQGTYIFKKCPGCGAKLHMDARTCQKCDAPYLQNVRDGQWEDKCYSSHDMEDAVYSTPMNKVEKCMTCIIVTQRGIACKPAYCFATGRVKCEDCRQFEDTRFRCCQEVQRVEGILINKDLELLEGTMQQRR